MLWHLHGKLKCSPLLYIHSSSGKAGTEISCGISSRRDRFFHQRQQGSSYSFLEGQLSSDLPEIFQFPFRWGISLCSLIARNSPLFSSLYNIHPSLTPWNKSARLCITMRTFFPLLFSSCIVNRYTFDLDTLRTHSTFSAIWVIYPFINLRSRKFASLSHASTLDGQTFQITSAIKRKEDRISKLMNVLLMALQRHFHSSLALHLLDAFRKLDQLLQSNGT